MKIHTVERSATCYHCTVCGAASGDGDGLIGQECPGPKLYDSLPDLLRGEGAPRLADALAAELARAKAAPGVEWNGDSMTNLDHLTAVATGLECNGKPLLAHSIQDAREEIIALRADKARLDWLADEHQTIDRIDRVGCNWIEGETLRSAIDRAITEFPE